MAGPSHVRSKAPIALRALPQQVGEGRVVRTSLNALGEVLQLGLPQLVGEVPEGRWGLFADITLPQNSQRVFP
jgi:hypothetical protein